MYEYRAIITRVIDGDTYVVNLDLGFYTRIFSQRVRLYGLDTPEVYGRYADPERGPAASDFVRTWLEANCPKRASDEHGHGHEVVLRTHKAVDTAGNEQESFYRWMAEVYSPGGSSLAEALKSSGHEKRGATGPGEDNVG